MERQIASRRPKYGRCGPVVVSSRDWPGERRVAGSILETTDFLTNSSGQATNALVSVRVHQAVKLVAAS